jgi:PAS domain-containing protein
VRARTKAPPRTCTPEGVRCASGKNYRVDTPECCLQHQRDIMDHIAGLFARHGIEWWADYGTLLGAHRNPMTTWADYPWLQQEGRSTAGPAAGIIPHDKDGDICVFNAQWEDILGLSPEVPWIDQRSPTGKPNQHRMIDGFEWIHKQPRRPDVSYRREQFGAGHSIKVRRSPSNHVNVDIFPWYRREGGTYYRKRYVGVDRYKGREFAESHLLPLGTIEWEGRVIPAPADPEWFCEHRYGPNWRTPLRANNDRVRR